MVTKLRVICMYVEQHAWSRRTHRLAQFLPNMAATEGGALSIDNSATQRRKMMANDGGGGAARPGRAVLSELGVLPDGTNHIHKFMHD